MKEEHSHDEILILVDLKVPSIKIPLASGPPVSVYCVVV